MNAPTVKAQLLEHRLGHPLAEWVAAGRRDGRSWRVLAAQVTRLTGQPVTHQSLRNWFLDSEDVA